MSDAWENLDPDDLEAEMERQEAYELSPAASPSKTGTCSSASKSSAWRRMP